MSAYNRVNGESASASQRLLLDILRKEWGFDGYVVSDCGAIDDIYMRHKLVATAEEASALGVTKGCDLECGSAYRTLGKAARARPSPGGGPGRGGPPAHAGADEARDVRPARAGGVRADPVLRQRRAGARPPRAAGGPGVDRPPEERRRPAPAQGPRHDRGGRAERRRPRHAARQLQRDALAAGHRARGDPGRRLARHPGPLRARGRSRRGPAGPARHGSHRGGLPAPGPRLVRARAHRGVLPRAGPPGRAGAHARGPDGGLPLGPRVAHRRARRAGRAERGAGARERLLLGPLDGRARAARLRRVRADGDRQRRRAPLRRRAQGPGGVERDERGAGRQRQGDPRGGPGPRPEARVLRGRAGRRGPAGLEAAGSGDAVRGSPERGASRRTSSSSWAASPPRSKARR